MERETYDGLKIRAGASVLLGFLFVLGTFSVLWAQSTAQISGVVKDQTGAVLPGVQVTATQTATGLARSAVSDETGTYTLTNLPAGPYKLEAALPGFRTFVQTGIVLQVGSSPIINVALEVGQVAETIEVEANAALVETRSTGIGQVIDNVRVLELPLNARNVQQLIMLSGNAVGGGVFGTNRGYPTDIISVAGGLNTGLTYLLDGGSHNDPYTNFNFPLPFPDALQEFKVETSSVPAQYGQHSGGAVNAITKSGTNEFHGDAFEYVRNRIFNARNTFATERDGLKRNQFGGVLGGPIIKNKLFFFGGDQATLVRSQPASIINFIPTPQMIAGDFTTIASPQCNNGRQITLKAPFVNNRIDPALLSPVALNVVKQNPVTNDPCGKVLFARKNNSNEQIILGRVDFQQSQKNSLFGRYELARLDQPSDYDGKTWFSMGQPDFTRRYHSFVLGDTYLLGSSVVSSFHGTVLRTLNEKYPKTPLFTWNDMGVKNFYYPPNWGKIVVLNVSGAFSTGPGGAAMHNPGVTNSTALQLAEDISWAHGAHQIGFGVNYIHSMSNWLSGTSAPGSFVFGAQNTGLSLGDFMLGRPSSFTDGAVATYYLRRNYTGLYLQDTWKATSHLTVSPGVRWEPYLPPSKLGPPAGLFSKAAFDQGVHSTVYKNAPAGVLFPGDPGARTTNALEDRSWMHFGPRLGLAYDPKGDGLMVVRGAYGLFFDYPHFDRYGGFQNTPPNGATVTIPNPVGGFEDPYLGYPGGNPFPITISPDMTFFQSGYTTFPKDLKKPYIHQWNLSVQRQVASDWLMSGSYLGNSGIHEGVGYQGNPAIYIPGASCVINGVTYSPCSTTSNTTQRRLLTLQNPAQGVNIGSVAVASDGGTRSFNGMVLSVQKRKSRGVTILANYTYSHCIDDGITVDVGSGTLPDRRRANRGNCEQDRRHNFNFSTVYETPQFSNRTVKALGSGWSVSGIVRVLSGSYLSVASGLDNRLTGEGGQRPNQVLASPYAATKTMQSWLNPAAFVQPAVGTYGTLGAMNILGPGSINIDMGITRTFKIGEKQSVQFRAEAFNVPNHVNPGNPDSTLTNSTFGRILSAADGRTMQMALKYAF
jgi:hypothetical protein